MRKVFSLILIIVLQCCNLTFAQVEDRGVRNKPVPPTEKRLALVIGNSAYQNTTALPNPQNDAADMKAALESLGFEVFYGVNQNARQMKALMRQFGDKLLQNKGVGLFYYAGHGIASGGENYLVPTDADIPAEDEIQDATVSLSFLLGKMAVAENSLNIVILDACRNNPFARKWRTMRDSSAEGGLATIRQAPTGTLIAYATQPGNTASDGTGRNGLYTAELLAQMKKPDLAIEEVFKNVRGEVRKKSKNQQVPWESSSIEGRFYFAENIVSPPVVKPPRTEISITEQTPAEVEREAWLDVQSATNPQAFRDFLEIFPNGANAGKAKIKLEQLVWASVKDSQNKARLQAFVTEFPNGVNVGLAKLKIRQLETVTTAPANPTNSGINTPTVPTKGTVRKGSTGIELVYIPSGEFQMGSSEAEIDEASFECKKYNAECKREYFTTESPKHKVTLKDGFWLGKYEVTQGQWQAIMGDNPSNFKDCGATCPVEKVSWDDIQVFLKRLNAKDTQFEYRLPSEAEWEYAARGGTTTAFAFGDSLNSTQANFDGNYPYASTQGKYLGKTVAVGSYQANNFGLYDMHGNVWEWVADIFNSSYSGLSVDGSANMSVGDSGFRVLRGGSWVSVGRGCRSADRGRDAPDYRYNNVGFRVAARPR